MKRFILVLVLLSLTGGGYYYYTLSARTTTDPQVVQAPVTSGDVVQAVQATGVLQALQTVNVGSQVSGIVSSLEADFNSIVKKGQVIARLDPSLLQVQVDLQAANVERQVGEIASQERLLENDERTLARVQMMFEKGLVPQQQLDEAALQVQVRRTQLDSAKKTLLTAEANLSQAQLNLSYTTIRSPIDGVVVNRLVDVGQAVQSSMNVAQFFTLATDLRVLKLQAGVDEADIGKIRPGMDVAFTVDAYEGETFRGTVETVRLDAQTQNNVVTFPVWITAPNPHLKLRPNMTATVQIIIATAPEAIRIPTAATRFRPTAEIYAVLGLTPPADVQRPAARAAGAGRNAAPVRANAAQRPAPSAAPVALDAASIDELFAPADRPSTRASVWTWDPDSRTLSEHRVRLGVSDGPFSELLDGDIALGQQVVTSVVVPRAAPAQPQQNLFGNPGGRGGFGR